MEKSLKDQLICKIEKLHSLASCESNYNKYIKLGIVNFLIDFSINIIEGKCSENELFSLAYSLNENANCSYSNNDLVNYDEAGKILGFGCPIG